MPDLASLFVFPLFLVFIRVGAAVMVLPGFSDSAINARTRLLVALLTSLVMFPLLQPQMPGLPTSTARFFYFMATEFMVGVFFGIAARMFMGALSVAGEMIAFAAGFQAASLFDPQTGANTLAPALFLLTIGTLLIFALDLHHVMIRGIRDSYTLFPPGDMPPLPDAVSALIQTVADVFAIGIRIAAPIMATGFLGYVAFGIFNRLIPQLHVFFVALPITIAVGLLMLGLSLGTMLTLFSTELMNHISLYEVELKNEL